MKNQILKLNLPMRNIPYGNHYLETSDFSYVKKVLNSNFITNGPYVHKFEDSLKSFFNTRYVATTSSGTSGLHLAFLSINLKKRDVVIMPAINFIASYNMAINLSAKVYLADVDKLTGQMTPADVENCIKRNKLKKIKCIVTMYLGGSPENLDNFYKIKKKYNCFLIEDACHAFGSLASFKKKIIRIGSNLNSDISVFSFHPVKAITTGEGGCVSTRSKIIFNRILKFRNHGIVRSKNHWNYNIAVNGYNYRLSDINCALGHSQLKQINKFLKKRNEIALFYKKELKNLRPYLTLPSYSEQKLNSYHLFLISINFRKLKVNKDFFLKYMLKNNIVCQFHYKPIYRYKIFNNKKILLKNFINAEYYYKNSLSLPIYYKLKLREQRFIINKIKNFILNNIRKF